MAIWPATLPRLHSWNLYVQRVGSSDKNDMTAPVVASARPRMRILFIRTIGSLPVVRPAVVGDRRLRLRGTHHRCLGLVG